MHSLLGFAHADLFGYVRITLHATFVVFTRLVRPVHKTGLSMVSFHSGWVVLGYGSITHAIMFKVSGHSVTDSSMRVRWSLFSICLPRLTQARLSMITGHLVLVYNIHEHSSFMIYIGHCGCTVDGHWSNRLDIVIHDKL